MNNIFIELTAPDDEKFSLNILHIVLIEPNKKGTTIKSSIGDSFIVKNVKESYSEVKAMMAALSGSR